MVVLNDIVVAIVTEPLWPTTPTKRVIRLSRLNSFNWPSTGQAYAIRPVCCVSVEVRLAVSLKKKHQVVQVNPKYARRELTLRLKVDEMWSFVGNKKRPRWLWWVEDAINGEVVAFVLGRRTHATFRRLLSVLKAAQIQVSGWITDAWCRAADAGLLRLFGPSDSTRSQGFVTKLGAQAFNIAYAIETVDPAQDLLFQVGGGS